MNKTLRELNAKATPGPWFTESEHSDGSYGSGEDTYEGYDVSIIGTEALVMYGKLGVLFESHNSTIGLIKEEFGEDGVSAWDTVSKANAAFIVALVNAYRAGELVPATARAAAERAEVPEPSIGLLMSIALRLDHGLAVPGYYDQAFFGAERIPHHRRLEVAISEARKAWEECAGQGYYRPEREAKYIAMHEAAARLTQDPEQGR